MFFDTRRSAKPNEIQRVSRRGSEQRDPRLWTVVDMREYYMQIATTPMGTRSMFDWRMFAVNNRRPTPKSKLPDSFARYSLQDDVHTVLSPSDRFSVSYGERNIAGLNGIARVSSKLVLSLSLYAP